MEDGIHFRNSPMSEGLCYSVPNRSCMRPQLDELYCPYERLLQAPRKCLLRVPIFSPSLGLRRWSSVYLSEGFTSGRDQPIVYLFRGNYTEWVNPNQDNTREGIFAEQVEKAIAEGEIPPVALVAIDLGADDYSFQTVPANFLHPLPEKMPAGLGTGELENYVRDECIPKIEEGLGLEQPKRMAIGFSLGGLSALMLGLRNPSLFKSLGIYDGSIFFHPLGSPDSILNNPMFDLVFGKPRNKVAVRSHSPTWLALHLPHNELDKISFYVQSGPKALEPYSSNYDRTKSFVDILSERTTLHPVPIEVEGGNHDWRTTDEFALNFLRATLGGED